MSRHPKYMIDAEKRIDEQEKNIEGFMSVEEIEEIWKNMKNNQSPGSDTSTTDTFKYCGWKWWNDAKTHGKNMEWRKHIKKMRRGIIMSNT